MKVLHTNYVDNTGRIYCYHLDKLIKFNESLISGECIKCPYYKDLLPQGEGIVCEFDDACDNVDGISFEDAGDAEYHSKMQYVRLGLNTEEEVIATLQSYNDYSKPEENDEEENEEKESEEDISENTDNLEDKK